MHQAHQVDDAALKNQCVHSSWAWCSLRNFSLAQALAAVHNILQGSSNTKASHMRSAPGAGGLENVSLKLPCAVLYLMGFRLTHVSPGCADPLRRFERRL